MIRTHDCVLATEGIGSLSYAVTKTNKFQTYYFSLNSYNLSFITQASNTTLVTLSCLHCAPVISLVTFINGIKVNGKNNVGCKTRTV
jgi:hypothetical protein